MSDIAIKVENLSKLYHIGSKKSGSFRESLGGMFKGKEDSSSEFWALKDVSFEIKKGEAVGIIGKNGAGKSTLLKILSRITEPTKGCIDINGRVSSLLEVGTGFHPELTGRENIFLNGTILGMTRREVKTKFDEIVDFSGIEKFLDTPVKHYSSGMYVRLAFAVAAHLEPEILIVDEVLAVGDAEFQKKCLGKMEEVTKNEGRTILFVSHNMGAIGALCSKGILLQNSSIGFLGEITSVISKYNSVGLNSNPENSCTKYSLNNSCSIEKFWINKNEIITFESLEYILIIKSEAFNTISGLALLLYNDRQERIAAIDLRHKNLFTISKNGNIIQIRGNILNAPLIEGEYRLGLYIESNLCSGDFLNLLKVNVKGRNLDIAPFSKNVRGYLELINEFDFYN